MSDLQIYEYQKDYHFEICSVHGPEKSDDIIHRRHQSAKVFYCYLFIHISKIR